MAKTIKISENMLRKVIAESVRTYLNEDAGAAYDINIEGLNVQNIQITGSDENTVDFTAEIVPGQCEWKAASYYHAVDSREGVFNSDGDLLVEFDDNDKKIDGGVISGYLYLGGYEDNEVENAAEIIKDDVLSDFDVDVVYGAGWSHVNLDSPEFSFKDFDIDGAYYTVHVNEIKLNAKGIADSINWFFANCDKLDEIYPGDEYEPAQQVRKQSKIL